MSYQIISDELILRLEDQVYIPKDETNGDYLRYQQWLEVPGNQPLAAPAPPVPSEPPAPPTAAEKLAAAGLTIEELKTLLAE